MVMTIAFGAGRFLLAACARDSNVSHICGARCCQVGMPPRFIQFRRQQVSSNNCMTCQMSRLNPFRLESVIMTLGAWCAKICAPSPQLRWDAFLIRPLRWLALRARQRLKAKPPCGSNSLRENQPRPRVIHFRTWVANWTFVRCCGELLKTARASETCMRLRAPFIAELL